MVLCRYATYRNKFAAECNDRNPWAVNTYSDGISFLQNAKEARVSVYKYPRPFPQKSHRFLLGLHITISITTSAKATIPAIVRFLLAITLNMKFFAVTIAALAGVALAAPTDSDKCRPGTYQCSVNYMDGKPGWSVCNTEGSWVVSDSGD